MATMATPPKAAPMMAPMFAFGLGLDVLSLGLVLGSPPTLLSVTFGTLVGHSAYCRHGGDREKLTIKLDVQTSRQVQDYQPVVINKVS